ncbi:MAG: PASTA domain-containing protein, partial [Oscillospiraceae bacterium]|nr:PASTA domain-containing protein [Oscillospiraceae bacterium]
EGMVTRTNPTKGEELQEGQKVEIWISTGKEVQMEKVPNVLGQSRDNALKLLNANGFKNVEFEDVESNQDKGMVVEQSEAPQTEIDVTTPIVLKISLGPEETTSPTEPPEPTVDPDLVDKIVTVLLPDDYSEPYTVSIWLNGEKLQSREIPVGTVSTQFSLTGKGIMEFEVRLNDSEDNSWPLEVDFDE